LLKKYLETRLPSFPQHLRQPSLLFLRLHFEIEEMGLLENVTGTLAQQLSQRGVGVVVAASLGAFLVLAVVLNVLSQLLLKNPNEPPIIFHWFPIVGSTIVYGMDPYKFFFDCRAKVSLIYWWKLRL
jgi:sterol 14-demethylase